MARRMPAGSHGSDGEDKADGDAAMGEGDAWVERNG